MQKRITIFDTVRGFTMISMAGFHACYDLAYLYDWDMPWFTQTVFQDIWRASISWVFLFIAGWMCTLSRNTIKRAAKYALAALVVWLATTLVSVDPGARQPWTSCTPLLSAASANHSGHFGARLLGTITLKTRRDSGRQLRHNANAVL